MQKKLVIAHIYRGYAVVKGQYYMYNTSDSVITLRTGYPENGSVATNTRFRKILFDQLYELRIFINGNPVEYQYLQFNSPPPHDTSENGSYWTTTGENAAW